MIATVNTSICLALKKWRLLIIYFWMVNWQPKNQRLTSYMTKRRMIWMQQSLILTSLFQWVTRAFKSEKLDFNSTQLLTFTTSFFTLKKLLKTFIFVKKMKYQNHPFLLFVFGRFQRHRSRSPTIGRLIRKELNLMFSCSPILMTQRYIWAQSHVFIPSWRRTNIDINNWECRN